MKLLVCLLLIVLLSACGYGNKYDGLMVVDGDGNVYILNHNIGDTYFITDIKEKESNSNQKNLNANKKLLSKNN